MSFTNYEKEYHMDLIEETIEIYEHRKERMRYSIEDHIELVIKYNEHADTLNGTTDIISLSEYKTLYLESVKLARRMTSIYQKQREFNFTDYYNFCKIISRMMEIIAKETGDEIVNLLQRMSM